MKHLILFFALLGFVQAVPVSLVVTPGGGAVDLDVPSGKRLSVLNFASTSAVRGPLVLVVAGVEFQVDAASYVVGPATLRIKPRDAYGDACSVLVTYDLETYSANYTPFSAVALSPGQTGPYSVALETSIDLVTWESALPGAYGSATPRRFFRVRLVAN